MGWAEGLWLGIDSVLVTNSQKQEHYVDSKPSFGSTGYVMPMGQSEMCLELEN